MVTRRYVSPRHTIEDLQAGDFETKVDVVEAHFQEWIFQHARFLYSEANPNRQQSALAVLTLVMPYFEAIEEFESGDDSTNQSKKFFRRGFRRVFLPFGMGAAMARMDEVAEAIATAVYDEMRCGLLHNAATRGRVSLSWAEPAPLSVSLPPADPTVSESAASVQVITVNPALFEQSVEQHFAGYIARIRVSAIDSQDRKHFAHAFDLRSGRTPRRKKG